MHGPSSFFQEHQLSMSINGFGVGVIHLRRTRLMRCANEALWAWLEASCEAKAHSTKASLVWHLTIGRNHERSSGNWQMRRVSIINLPENVMQHTNNSLELEKEERKIHWISLEILGLIPTFQPSFMVTALWSWHLGLTDKPLKVLQGHGIALQGSL